VIAGIGVSKIVKNICNQSCVIRILASVALLCVLLSVSIGLTNGFTNARIQISVDSVNANLVEYLASNIPVNGILFVNIPEPNEYMFEIGVHLSVLKQRPDIRVHYFDRFKLSSDVAVFIVSPIMQNQPYPSVRIAVQEDGAKIWKSELHTKLGDGAALVYEKVETVPLFTVAVETVICPWLMRTHVRDVAHCGVNRPVIDRRVFRYGWEVYRDLIESSLVRPCCGDRPLGCQAIRVVGRR
jgi:hypothetical protein